jgi:hypothetical protein
MATINREFFVRLDQTPRVIINFLPEPQRDFLAIHFLEIPGALSQPAHDFHLVTPPAFGQFLPLSKLSFILCPRAHASSSN